MVKPKKIYIVTKIKTLASSTIKYLRLIFFLQFLHFPLRRKKDIKGKLSNHLIFFLQEGQLDRFITTLCFLGRRYMQTFAKLPHIPPKIIDNKINTK